MEQEQLKTTDLEVALDAVRVFVPKAPEQLKTALLIYLCSFTLLKEAYLKQPKELEPEDITVATLSAWAAEFCGQYKEDGDDLDKTYIAFISWLKTKQNDCIDNLS